MDPTHSHTTGLGLSELISLVGPLSAVLLIGIAVLWKELRESRKESSAATKEWTSQFISLQHDQMENGARTTQVLERLTDRVENLPCAVENGLREKHTPLSSGRVAER